MPKPLRIGLAMGGGTSQGTFSGAALTEALKLLVLYGGEAGSPHPDVRIDAISGASAGSIALAVLIRSLLRERSADEKATLADALLQHYKGDFARIGRGTKVWEDLVALQAAQDDQEQVWTRLVHLAGLLGDTKQERNEPEILRRSAVDDIARKVLTAPTPGDFAARRLLGDRVLYACTLANLTPLVARGKVGDPRGMGLIGLEDATRSLVHRDIRVFDFRFAPAGPMDARENPGRWNRYHAFGAVAGVIGDLRLPRTWARIAATAIASGAFPFGFAPVVLSRRKREFGDLWPEGLGADPETQHPFTYVDGGTFNNEPLREAFRLAAHLDAVDRKVDADRHVLLVDPNVSRAEPPGLRVGVHRDFGARGKPLSSLARLLPQAGALLGAIRNEAAVREADKVAQVRDLFELRNLERRVLLDSLDSRGNPGPAPTRAAAFEHAFDICERRMLAKDLTDASLPPGTLTLADELERVLKEESKDVAELTRLREKAAGFLRQSHPELDPQAGLWLYALNCVALDLLLGLEGKNEGTRVLGIAPCRHPENPTNPGHFDLPGEAVGTFAGFMSPVAQCKMLQMGRFCAWKFLDAYGVIAPPLSTEQPEFPEFTGEETKRFEGDVDKGLGALAERIKVLLDQEIDIPILPDGFIFRKVAEKVVGGLKSGFKDRGFSRVSHVLRIQVPTKDCELEPVAKDLKVGKFTNGSSGPFFRLTLAEFVSIAHDPITPGSWAIGTADKTLRLRWERGGKKRTCTLAPPPQALVDTAATLSNPVFTAEIRIDDTGTVGPDRWQLQPDVRPLEEDLLLPGKAPKDIGPACPPPRP